MKSIDWLKRNWNIAVAALVFVCLLGGMALLLRSSRCHRRRVTMELQQQQEMLRCFYAAPVFPSPENLQIVRKDRDALDHRNKVLERLISGKSIEIGEVAGLTPVEFSKRKDKVIEELRSAVRTHGVLLPEGFSFGFGRYNDVLPCKDLPQPRCNHLLRQMLRQLVVVEQLTQLMISSGVQEIYHIKRSDPEPGGSENAESLGVAVKEDPNASYHAMPFELQFSCGTEQLRTFLNNLAQAERLFTTRLLTVNSALQSVGSATKNGNPSKKDEGSQLSVTIRVDLVEFPAAYTNQTVERKVPRL